LSNARRTALELTNEEKLLVLIADSSTKGAYVDAALRDEASSLLGRAFDWRRFMKLARYHLYLAVAASFFKNLKMFLELPPDVREVLESEYFLSHARFLKKEHELVELVQELETEDIYPIVVKGIPLAYTLYEDFGARASKDIDILISPPDLERAKKVLARNGYCLHSGIRSAEDFRTYHFHYVYCRGEHIDSVVELHWNLLYPTMDHCIVDRAQLEEQAIVVEVRGRAIKTLSFPHAFWHMSMHALYRYFLAFRSLAEMRGIGRRLEESDWQRVFSWSAQCNTEREVTLAVNLCESLFGKFSGATAGNGTRPGVFMRRFVLNAYYPRALVWEWLPFSAAQELVVSLYLRKGFAHRLKYLYRLVFPDRATLFNLYFDYRKEGTANRMRMHFNGLYVLVKVIFLALFGGFMIQSGIMKPRALDPELHKRIEEPQ
jgi:hypothetical protein